MAHTPRDILERRLRCDQQILAGLQDHLTHLESARQTEFVARATAQRNLDAIECELDAARLRCASLHGSMQAVRSALRRCQMDTFPLELLRDVFLELCSEPDELWDVIGRREYDEPRSRQPFDIAAVCGRWRQLALATPVLWSDIAVPAPGTQPERRTFYYVQWVQDLLHRSKGSSVDILLPWKEDSVWRTNSYASKILTAIAQHAHRWRRFEFHIPLEFMSFDAASIFRRPTPCLEWFCILSPDVDDHALEWTSAYPRYLPVCPRLVTFRSDFTNLLLAVPRQPIPHLARLEICVNTPCKVVWDLLHALPTLEELNVQIEGCDRPSDISDPPEHLVQLSALRTLALYEDACEMFAAGAGLVSLPSLAIMHVDPGMELLLGFFQTCSSTVETLYIVGHEIGLDELPCLQELPNVRELRFEDCIVHDDLLQALAVSDQGTLLRLATLTLDQVDLDPPDGDGLVHLVRSRASPPASSDDTLPTKLDQLVITDSPNVPAWLVAEVRYLMGEELSLSDTDSVADPTSEDTDESEEAQFTDSGAEDSSDSSDSDDQSWVPDRGSARLHFLIW